MAGEEGVEGAVRPSSGAPFSAVSVRTDDRGEPACPICRSTAGKARYTLHEMNFGTREAFEYVHCGACGVLWLPDPPADMSAHYPTAYYDGLYKSILPPVHTGLARWLHDRQAARKLFRGHRLSAAIGRRLGPPLGREVKAVKAIVSLSGLRSFADPIVDVGSSPTPDRLVLLARAGFRDLMGIDPQIPGDTEYHGIPIRRMGIAELAARAPGRYGLITFHHSFEHVGDPRPTLRAAATLARPNGAVLIRTPVMGTWFWEQYGTSWWELDPPRHLFVHTPRSLELLAHDVGLELRDTEYESSPSEIVASEQIARGIPWRDPRSFKSDPEQPEGRRRYTETVELVKQLNAEGRGGRARFILRKPA